MQEFWLKVSNIFEMTLYLRRYDSYSGLQLARGDINEEETLKMANLQKLIERTEMGVNSEYRNIVELNNIFSTYGFTIDFNQMENEYYDWDVEEIFDHRFAKLMVDNEKMQRIEKNLSLGSYELFLHKALILSLEMISYFDSERNSSYNEFSTLEECQLMNLGLLTSLSSTLNSNAIGLMVSSSDAKDNLLFSNRFIAMSIEISQEESEKFQIPNSVLFLSLILGGDSDWTNVKFLEDCSFQNVIDLTIKMPQFLDDTAEKNILQGITRSRFPKLVRLSVKYVSLLENIFTLDIVGGLLYLEILTQLPHNRWDSTNYFSSGMVHKMIQDNLIEKDSLMHHLITNANMLAKNPDADYNSVESYYEITKEKFVASISHSSINEFYNPSTE
ncbi:predicted protein [Naegleria gruberi]|uniref:Predicted protein n=1 Tax=Naegleria gruberi TaxID=5762 RepID=D2VVC3_NAEGR|nr:uncharacterized protein NAEGRDRAFT_52551 [Naegleria gruberi]EFC39284.1 predicted protein [Naegleria gruberi]|eukprot:XP_002672028.1 predicted protein [Naegleria gruberi strain NEG-M]